MGIVRDVRRREIAVRGLVAWPAISGIFLGAVATLCRYPSGGRHAVVLGAFVACAAYAANLLVIYLTVVVAARRARPEAADEEVTAARVVSEDLNLALNNRVLLENATGIVGERAGLDMEQASFRLRAHAHDRRLRLVDVASEVIAGTDAAPTLLRRPTTAPSCGRRGTYEQRARRRHR